MNAAARLAWRAPQGWQGRTVTWFGALFIGAILALSAYDVVRTYRNAIADTGRELDSHARMIAEQTARSLQAVDVVLRHLSEQLGNGNLASLSRDDLHAYLGSQAVGLVQVDGLVVFNPDGTVRAVSLLPPRAQPEIDVSGDAIFQRLKSESAAGLVIDGPMRSPGDGRWVFPIGRRVESSGGRFTGAVGARGHIDYFERFYQDLNLDAGIAITLMHANGTLIARYPRAEGVLGKRFPTFDETRAAYAAGAAGPVRAVSPVDGVERFAAVRAVPDYPLAVVATRDIASALAPWRAQTMGTALRTLSLALLAAVLLTLLKRQLARLVAARKSLETSQERFALAVAGSDDGIWDWDYRTGTAFGSARAREILGLPPGAEERSLVDWLSELESHLHPQDIARRSAALEAHLAGRTPTYEGEYRVRKPDGGYRWVRIRGLCVRRGTGRPYRMAGSVSDIDARKLAEESLRQSEERYALAMTGSNEGHWVWELAGDELFASPTMNEIFGLARDARVTNWAGYFERAAIPAEDWPGVQQAFRDQMAGRSERLDIEHRIRLPDGAERWVHSRGQCFRDAGGKAVRMAGATVDVSDRKRAEEALRKSEERYALAMTGSNEGHWVWEIASDELYASAKLNELFGFEASPAVTRHGEYFARIPTHPDDDARVRAARDDHIAGRTPRLDVEYRVVDPASGEIRWIHTRARCFRDAAGNAIRLAGSTMDVTARKRIEQALRESEERFAVSVAGSNDGIIDWDIVNDRLYASERAMEILGLDRSVSVRPRAQWAQMVAYHPDDVARVQEDLRRCLEGDADLRDGEYRVRLPDGGYRWIRHRNKCVRDASGKPIRFSGSVSDIDAHKRAEEALRRSEERFALAVAGSDDGIWDWNYETGQGFGSQRARAILGIAPGPETMPLAAWSEACEAQLHPEDVARRRAAIEAHLAGAVPWYAAEYRVRDDADGYRWISERGLSVRRGDARPHRMAGSVTDIDARKRAEEALRVSQERYAIAMTGSHEAHWVWDLARGEIHVSPLLNDLYGLAPDTQVTTVEGLFAAVRIHAEDQERVEAAMADHVAGATPRLDVEYRIVNRASGAVRWVHTRAQCFRRDDGHSDRMAGATVEVTERRRAELALRESEERYALAIAGTNDGIIDWDLLGDRMFASARALRILGIDGEAVVRTRAEWLAMLDIHPEDRERHEHELREHLEGRTPVREGEYRVRHRDGAYHWVRVRGVCVRDGQDRPVRFAGSVSDIDSQKRVEQALRASDERYQLAVAGANQGLWDWDLASDVLFLSLRAQEMMGFAPGETQRPRRDWIALCEYHPDDLATIRKAMSRHLHGATAHFAVEYRQRHASGSWHWYRERGLAVRDGHGRPYRMAGSIEDITDTRAAEAERGRLEAQLRQAQKLEAIGTLAGGIAHDFNNILAAILGYGEMAQKDAPEGTALRRHVDAALSAGMRAKSLVERILAFSRSGMGERVPVHVQSVVGEALDAVAAALPAGVALERRLAAGGAAVLGDPTQVHQVVMNLCANAIQALKVKGSIVVALEVIDQSERVVATSLLAAGRYVRLRVQDTGNGIAPHVLERIFDPFFTTKEVGVGTGLGLSLVHGIVTDLGGGIDVESRLGAGSTFTVYLPWRGEMSAPEAVVEDLPGGSGETILLVDDEEPLVRLGEEMIAGLGYEPVGFTSSQMALASFRAAPERFNAVLSDEAMPDMTGSELALEIRKIRPDIPIVLMSGYVTSALSARARHAGVREVLAKPLVASDIARSLASALHP